MNLSIKNEDEIIDLDAEEPISVCKWDEQIRLVLLRGIEGKSFLENLVTFYIRSLQEQIRVCKAKILLKNKILEHLNYFKEQFYLLSEFMVSSSYFDLMEDILSYYCTLELDIFRKENRHTGKSNKGYLKNAKALAQKMCTVLTVYLDKREMHILHVLLKVKYSCKSDPCKCVMKAVYRYVLFCGPVQNYSDEAFCRNYIVFCRYKELMPPEIHRKMDFSIFKRFKKADEKSLEKNEIWKTIFMVNPTSIVDAVSLIMDIKYKLVSSYFNYIRKNQSHEQLLLRTNTLLPIGNKEFQEDQLASRLFGDSIVTNLINSSPPEQDDTEVIINSDKPSISKIFVIPSDDEDNSDVEITYIEMIRINEPEENHDMDSVKIIPPVKNCNKEQVNALSDIQNLKSARFEKNDIYTKGKNNVIERNNTKDQTEDTNTKSNTNGEKPLRSNGCELSNSTCINTSIDESQTNQTKILLTNITSQPSISFPVRSHPINNSAENKENKLEEHLDSSVALKPNLCFNQITDDEMNVENVIINESSTSVHKVYNIESSKTRAIDSDVNTIHLSNNNNKLDNSDILIETDKITSKSKQIIVDNISENLAKEPISKDISNSNFNNEILNIITDEQFSKKCVSKVDQENNYVDKNAVILKENVINMEPDLNEEITQNIETTHKPVEMNIADINSSYTKSSIISGDIDCLEHAEDNIENSIKISENLESTIVIENINNQSITEPKINIVEHDLTNIQSEMDILDESLDSLGQSEQPEILLEMNSQETIYEDITDLAIQTDNKFPHENEDITELVVETDNKFAGENDTYVCNLKLNKEKRELLNEGLHSTGWDAQTNEENISQSIHISTEDRSNDCVNDAIELVIVEPYISNSGIILIDNCKTDSENINQSTHLPTENTKYDEADQKINELNILPVLPNNAPFLADNMSINTESIINDQFISSYRDTEVQAISENIINETITSTKDANCDDSVKKRIELDTSPPKIAPKKSSVQFKVNHKSSRVHSDSTRSIYKQLGNKMDLKNEGVQLDNVKKAKNLLSTKDTIYDEPNVTPKVLNSLGLNKLSKNNSNFFIGKSSESNVVEVENTNLDNQFNNTQKNNLKMDLEEVKKIKKTSFTLPRDEKKVKVLQNFCVSPETKLENFNIVPKIMYTSNPSELNNNKNKKVVEPIDDIEESFSGPLINAKPTDGYLFTNINISNKPVWEATLTDKNCSSGMKNSQHSSTSRKKIHRDSHTIHTCNDSVQPNIFKEVIESQPSTSGIQSKHISWPEENLNRSDSPNHTEENNEVNLKSYYMQYASCHLSKGILKKPKQPKQTTVASKLNLNVSEAYEHLKRRRKPTAKENYPAKVRIIEKSVQEEKDKVSVCVEQDIPEVLCKKHVVISLPKYSENELIQQYYNELNISKHNTKRSCILSRIDVQKNKSPKASPSPVPKPADYFKDHPVTGTVDYIKYICDDTSKFYDNTSTGADKCIDVPTVHNSSLFSSPIKATNLAISSKTEEEPQLQIEFSNSPKFLNEQQLEQCLSEKNGEESTDHSINNLLGNVSFLSDNSNFYTTCVQENVALKNTNLVSFYNHVNAVIKDDVRETNHEVDNIIISNNVIQVTNTEDTANDNYNRTDEKPVHNDLDPDVDKESNKSNHANETDVCHLIDLLKTETDTRLPFKKRRMSVSIKHDVQETVKEEISYPATPMISIAEVEALQNKRTFKTPAERKEMPSLPPIYHAIPSATVEQFNNFNAPPVSYHLNNIAIPYMPCTPFYTIPPMLLPFNNIPNFDSNTNITKHAQLQSFKPKKEGRMKKEKNYENFCKYTYQSQWQNITAILWNKWFHFKEKIFETAAHAEL